MYLPEQRVSRNCESSRTCENGLGVLFARKASRGEVRLSSQVRGEDSLHQRELSPLCSQAEAVQEPARTGRVPKPCPEKGCGHLSQSRPCRHLSHERGNGLVLLLRSSCAGPVGGSFRKNTFQLGATGPARLPLAGVLKEFTSQTMI